MGWDKTKTDPLKWALDMSGVGDEPGLAREAINIFAFEVFKRVVMRTPVDTGACRQNWLVTINNETDEYDPSLGKGGRVLSDGGKGIQEARGDATIYIQNNTPYAAMLEFGGYGKAKGQGDSLKGRKFPGRGKKTTNENGDSPPVEGQKAEEQKDEKKSKITADGYSLQAPHGMIGVTMAKKDVLWERSVQAAKSSRAERQTGYENLFGGQND